MDSLLITATLILGLLGLLYGFLISNIGGWKKKGVPEAKSYPGIGTFPATFTQSRHFIYDVDEVYRQFRNKNKYVGVYSGRAPQFLILDPELAHKIYVNDFNSFHDNEFGEYIDEKSDLISANNPFFLRGEEWKERRTEMIPGMTPNRIKSAYPVTLDVCKRLSDYINQKTKLPPQDGLDMYELCLKYTTEVVSDCVLGINAASISDNPSHLVQQVQDLFRPSTSLILQQIAISLLPCTKHIWKMTFFNKSVTKYFFDLMENAIEMRRKHSNNRVDFLNFLLHLQEKKKLPSKIMGANIMTFLTDGFFTTAQTVAHCLLYLARNPKIQEKLREEILNNINEDGIVTFESLSEMPYLNACFNEAIRILPPLPMNTKLCTKPYEFVNSDGRSYKMKKGEVVVIIPYSYHHDERYFEEPEKFKPERFLGDKSLKEYREEGKYLGFGDGPRICMGMRFALTQGKAAIVELVRHFHLKVNPKTRNDNVLDKKEFLTRLDGGIWLDFEAIK
ncbi:probable cytochrome P450 28d1 [Stomoxys calcitrans]|uniref:Cytochrome P450 n=1 Tax=Stomoxys calcitrans TaxID=35570 RepID=A0A1I8PHW3_STOCA|nr:probable cytochrome P450 28d1 [Stomoxys calcitrans]